MPIVSATLADLDLTPEPRTWWPHQHALAQALVDSPKPVVLLEVETGSGKSTIAYAAAKAADVKAIILTQTRQLQRQYIHDFPDMQLIEGRAHFTCNLLPERTAATAPCTAGYRCPLQTAGCDYFDQKRTAAEAPVSIQNYAYWFAESQQPKSAFQTADWLICDEGHDVDQILMQAGEIELRWELIDALSDRPERPTEAASWQVWANQWMPEWTDARDQLRRDLNDWLPEGEDHGEALGAEAVTDLLRRHRQVMTIRRAGQAIAQLTPETIQEWVPDHTRERARLRPIYGKYAFKRLRKAATSKLILMSAFLAPELLMRTLGLEEDEVEIITGPEIFDRSISPIYYCPVGKFGYKTSENMWGYAIGVIDAFRRSYRDAARGDAGTGRAPERACDGPRRAQETDRRAASSAPASSERSNRGKGLLHVPSYHLRDRVARTLRRGGNSTEGCVVLTYERGEKDACLADFLEADQPTLLIGQSLGTGVDLPYGPSYNIILKLAFPPTTDPVIKARMATDTDFYPFLTICETVQAAGRAMRAPDHACDTIILDEHFGWFYRKHRAHFPGWFRKALRQSGWKEFPEINSRRVEIARAHRIMLRR